MSLKDYGFQRSPCAGFEGAVFVVAWALLPGFWSLSLSGGYIYFLIFPLVEGVTYYRYASPQRLRSKLEKQGSNIFPSSCN
jgi:hypothetical protein